jgi:hypothetical protein
MFPQALFAPVARATPVTPTSVSGSLAPETPIAPHAVLRPVGVGDPAPTPPPIAPAAGLPSPSQQAAMQHGLGMDRRPRLPHEGRMRAMNIAHQVLGGLGPAMRAQAASGDQFGPSMIPTLMGSIPHQPMPSVVFP